MSVPDLCIVYHYLLDWLRSHLATICAVLPQVRPTCCAFKHAWLTAAVAMGSAAAPAAWCGCQPWVQLRKLPLMLTATLLQVWQVISQRRQEGAGGLARLHSALISTGECLVADWLKATEPALAAVVPAQISTHPWPAVHPRMLRRLGPRCDPFALVGMRSLGRQRAV